LRVRVIRLLRSGPHWASMGVCRCRRADVRSVDVAGLVRRLFGILFALQPTSTPSLLCDVRRREMCNDRRRHAVGGIACEMRKTHQMVKSEVLVMGELEVGDEGEVELLQAAAGSLLDLSHVAGAATRLEPMLFWTQGCTLPTPLVLKVYTPPQDGEARMKHPRLAAKRREEMSEMGRPWQLPGRYPPPLTAKLHSFLPHINQQPRLPLFPRHLTQRNVF